MAYRITGVMLPDGQQREWYVVDGRFSADPVEGAEDLVSDAVLVPGLVDVHAHLALSSPAGDRVPVRERVIASGRVHLDAGVLAVREPGSLDHTTTGMGPQDGMPRTVTAGRFLALPGSYFPGLARTTDDDNLPDAAVEELTAGGGTWAKVIGDSPIGPAGMRPTFSEAALTETVQRVHAAGGRVAVHCALPEVVDRALRAGVDSLEHASLLRPDQVPDLAAAGAAWVPTLSITEAVRGLVRQFGHPEEAVRAVDEGLGRLPEVLRAAADAGVLVLAGTDAGVGPHGQVAGEIALLMAAGLAPDVALGGGSWAARAWLGLPGIEHGAPADLVAYREDPREDPTVLQRPALVMLAGRVLRRPG